MAFVFQERLKAIFNGKMTAQQRWLRKIRTDGRVSANAAAEGEIKISFIPKSTASTPVAGTLNSNAVNMTAVSGTLTSREVTLLLPYHEFRAQITQPGGIEEVMENHAEALFTAGETALVADIVATAPVKTNTLPVGQIDFISDGTAAENYLAINALNKSLFQFVSQFNQYSFPGDYHIMLPATAWANIMTAREPHTNWLQVGSDGIARFKGVEMFPGDDAITDFGGANNTSAIIGHKDSFLFTFLEPFLSNNGPFDAGDSQMRWTTNMPFAYATVGADAASKYFWAQVLNPAT